MTATQIERLGPKMVTATEAKCNLSALLAGVLYHRERVVITKHGRPVAEIVPVGEHAGGAPVAGVDGR